MTLYQEVRSAFREGDFRPRKRLGQNFLIHERVIDSILRLLELSPDDEVLEIGPGLGFLTRRLVEGGARVCAVEVDRFLFERLRSGPLEGYSALRLIHGDILKIPLPSLLDSQKVKVAGNLPYSISTPLLFHLFEHREHFSSLVFMVQKEVADRIAARPGSKGFGALSVMSQIHGRITECVAVSPDAFFPRPKVRSTILKMELLPQPLARHEDLRCVRAVVRAAFGRRRKTLANALTAGLSSNRESIEAVLEETQIDPRRRGETLTPEEFVLLARSLKERGLVPSGN